MSLSTSRCDFVIQATVGNLKYFVISSEAAGSAPTEEKSAYALSPSSSVAWLPSTYADAAWPMRQGVLGMTRTTRVPSGRLASRLAMRTPAAMLITRCRAARCGCSACRMLSRYCGFTCHVSETACRQSCCPGTAASSMMHLSSVP